MEKNKYFKAKLIMRSDEELVYNTFPLYLIFAMELFLLAILQEEMNWISGSLLILCVCVACTASYKIGKNKR